MIPTEMMKELIETKVGFVERMGLKVLELSPRFVKLLAPLNGNENHVGTMYAGAMFTLAEIPGGAVFLTSFDISKYYPLVKEMNIRFLKPATSDLTIELSLSEDKVSRIIADADENGKADFTLEGELKDESGRVVAVSSGVYQIRTIGK